MKLKNKSIGKLLVHHPCCMTLFLMTTSGCLAFDFKEVVFTNIHDCRAFLPAPNEVNYKFTGKCVGRQANGIGELEALKDGRSYYKSVVYFRNGRISSMSPIKFQDGTIVTPEIIDGAWKSGEKNVPEKYDYKGSLDGFTEHGFGLISFSDGTTYSGDFLNGRRTGIGAMKGLNFAYSGEFVNDKFNGQGKFEGLYFDRKVTYVGSFTESTFGPKGLLIDKDMYDGEFKYGVPAGYGLYTFSTSSDTYSGKVKTLIKRDAGKLSYEILFHGQGTYSSKDGSYRMSGTWTNDKKEGGFKGARGKVNIDALFINDKPVWGTFEQIGAFIYRGDINGETWKPGGLGELTLVSTGSKTIGNFYDWLTCVGQCFTSHSNGIIVSAQNDQNGKAIPGTLMRIDDGAEQFYASRRKVENSFSVTSKMIRDQLNAFNNIDDEPEILNKNQPVTLIDSTGKRIGGGVLWSTQQPGMAGGGNFLKIYK